MTTDTMEEIMEDLDEYGYLTVECDRCGETHTLEADGKTVCDCGKTVESPLLTECMI